MTGNRTDLQSSPTEPNHAHSATAAASLSASAASTTSPEWRNPHLKDSKARLNEPASEKIVRREAAVSAPLSTSVPMLFASPAANRLTVSMRDFPPLAAETSRVIYDDTDTFVLPTEPRRGYYSTYNPATHVASAVRDPDFSAFQVFVDDANTKELDLLLETVNRFPSEGKVAAVHGLLSEVILHTKATTAFEKHNKEAKLSISGAFFLGQQVIAINQGGSETLLVNVLPNHQTTVRKPWYEPTRSPVKLSSNFFNPDVLHSSNMVLTLSPAVMRAFQTTEQIECYINEFFNWVSSNPANEDKDFATSWKFSIRNLTQFLVQKACMKAIDNKVEGTLAISARIIDVKAKPAYMIMFAGEGSKGAALAVQHIQSFSEILKTLTGKFVRQNFLPDSPKMQPSTSVVKHPKIDAKANVTLVDHRADVKVNPNPNLKKLQSLLVHVVTHYGTLPIIQKNSEKIKQMLSEKADATQLQAQELQNFLLIIYATCEQFPAWGPQQFVSKKSIIKFLQPELNKLLRLHTPTELSALAAERFFQAHQPTQTDIKKGINHAKG